MEPSDASERRAAPPVVCYPDDALPRADQETSEGIRQSLKLVSTVTAPPRQAAVFRVRAGQVFRITSVEGPQVGDLNLWNGQDLTERFFSGKTRALHGTHVVEGDRLWSNLPHLRAMATVLTDTLGWYGIDEDGGSVHDVIGTRCDPYTHNLLSGGQYHHCCHSNLTRALADDQDLAPQEAEWHVHDVLNVFMCTGLHARYGTVFHEGVAGASRGLYRICRRNGSSGRSQRMPGRRLFRHAFKRHGRVLSASSGRVRCRHSNGMVGWPGTSV